MASIEGTLGSDTLTGTDAADTILGYSGADRLAAGAGDDRLEGGDGDDTLEGGLGPDLLIGGAGDDRLDGGEHDDTLDGGDGNDSLVAALGHDLLVGGAGNDTMASNWLTATLRGGAGDDRYVIEAPRTLVVEHPGEGRDLVEFGVAGASWTLPEAIEDVNVFANGVHVLGNALGNELRIASQFGGRLDGMGGNDTLHAGGYATTLTGGDGDDALYGSKNSDRLDGGAGDDSLEGGGFADTLAGGAGNDRLQGGEGNDELDGGPGADWMTGGLGADRYWVDDPHDVVDEYDQGGSGDPDTIIVGVSGFKVDRSVVESAVYRNDALPLAYWVDALVSGFAWHPPGDGGEVRFAAAPEIDVPGFGVFSSSDLGAAAVAFGLWAQGTRLSPRATSLDEADVWFAFADLEEIDAAGVTFFVAEAGVAVVLIDDEARGGLVSTDARWQATLLHEIGHALGLKHPGQYLGDDSSVAPYLPAAEDDTRHTLMSYVESAPRATDEFVTRLPWLDRAAAQYLYGLAGGLAEGDTTWRLSALTGPDAASRCIEDSAGVDTIDASDLPSAGGPDGGAIGATIDLRVGGRLAVGTPAVLISAAGQAAVGYGSVIEHAIGSSGPDTITGNAGDNRLEGGQGDDSLLGAGGVDTLLGGAGGDTLVGGAGLAGLLDGGDGDDVLAVRVASLAALATLTVAGGAGSDTLELRLDARTIDYALGQALLAWRALPSGASGSDAALGFTYTGIEALRWGQFDGAAWQPAAPLVSNAPVTADEDTPLQVRLSALDLGNAALTYALLEGPAYGAMTLSPDGLLRYTPPPGQSYSHLSFRWSVSNATQTTEVTTAFEVRAVDDPPVQKRAVDNSHTTPGASHYHQLLPDTFEDVDSALSYAFELTDGRPLPAWMHFDSGTNSLVAKPTEGDVGEWAVRWIVGPAAPNGDPGFAGATASTTFTIGVYAPANHAPRFEEYQFALTRDMPFVVPAPVDEDGDPITVQITRAPEFGVLTPLEGGRWQYQPAAGFVGSDTVSFDLRDGRHGHTTQTLQLLVRPPDRPPVGDLLITGRLEIGHTVQALVNFSDPDGTGWLWWQWYRDGEPLAGYTSMGYYVQPADIGHRLSVAVSYTDGAGYLTRVSSTETIPVPDVPVLQGTPAADRLVAAGTSRIYGGAGNDTIEAGPGLVAVDAGAGDDAIRIDVSYDTIDGGPGFDTLWITRDAQYSSAYIDWTNVSGVEAVIGTPRAETIVLTSGSGVAHAMAVRGGAGDDWIYGSPAIDTAHLSGRAAAYGLYRNLAMAGQPIHLFDGPDGSDQLTDIERLRFDDMLLAFGDRAIEVARVAFALWNPAIAGSRYLFARGISYYDVGYSYQTLIDTALGYFTSDTPQQFAERLAGNVASGRTAAEILALMQANGGAAAGEGGRAYATKLVADDAANLRSIELAGLISHGIACDLVVDGNLLFAPLGG